MSERDIKPAPLEDLPAELQKSLEKVGGLIKTVREENPGPYPLGLSGNHQCPYCYGIARWTITGRGGLYLECISSGCFETHSRPSGDMAAKPSPNRQGRLL